MDRASHDDVRFRLFRTSSASGSRAEFFIFEAISGRSYAGRLLTQQGHHECVPIALQQSTFEQPDLQMSSVCCLCSTALAFAATLLAALCSEFLSFAWRRCREGSASALDETPVNAMRRTAAWYQKWKNEGVMMVQQFSRRCSHWGKHERRDGTTLGKSDIRK